MYVASVWVCVTETAGTKRSHWTRLCGACTMLVLLGVPWIFSAFVVINTAGNQNLEMLQGIFNVSEFAIVLYRPTQWCLGQGYPGSCL